MAKVPVIERLFELPSIVTHVSRVSFPTGTYFIGVWSMLMIKAGGMWCFSTMDTISCRNKNSISLRAPSGMSTLDDVFLLFTKFILSISFLPNARSPRQLDQQHKGTCSSKLWQWHLLLWCLSLLLFSRVKKVLPHHFIWFPPKVWSACFS